MRQHLLRDMPLHRLAAESTPAVTVHQPRRPGGSGDQQLERDATAVNFDWSAAGCRGTRNRTTFAGSGPESSVRPVLAECL